MTSVCKPALALPSTLPEWCAPSSPADRELYSSSAPQWVEGIPGNYRPDTPGTDSSVLALVVASLVLIGFNMRHVKRLFKTLPADLLSVRRRENAFDEQRTAHETRSMGLLLLQLFIAEALILFQCFVPMGYHAGVEATHTPVFATLALLVAVAAAFYLFRLASCAVVGYTFTDSVNMRLWIRGLNSADVLLGLAITVPALVAVFYPAISLYMIGVSAACYVASRICFISKGFKIFYTNFWSLLYFILYLCTLEIIPLMITCALASNICVNI